MRLPFPKPVRILVLAWLVLVTSLPEFARAEQSSAGPGASTSKRSTEAKNSSELGPPAPSKAQMQAGKKFFVRGQELYQAEKYEAAWIEFSSAYEIAPLPDLVFNMARCEVRMNRIKEAIGHYREFLRKRPDDPESERIRDEITRLERQLNGNAEQLPPPPPPPPPSPPPRRMPVASITLGSTAVLFAVLGGVAIGVATSKYNGLAESCKPHCSDDEVQGVRTPLNAGYAMFGLAAAAGVATLIILPFELGAFRKSKDKDRKVALGFGPSFLSVAGRY